MSKFKVGDRVRYIGCTTSLKGTDGIVVSTRDEDGYIKYAINCGGVIEVLEDNVELFEEIKLHNIVQVRYKEDYNADWYCFNVPDGIELKKGDVVRVRNRKGSKETVAICVTDSEVVNENTLNMIMKGNNVISNVIGKYQLEMFEE